MKKIISLIIIIILFCFILSVLWFGIDIFNMFKSGKTLDYNQDIMYLKLLEISKSKSNKLNLKVDNKKDINEIMDYINSLELVECKSPSHYLKENDYIHMYIYGEDELMNVITVTSRYLYLTKKSYDFENKTYYIKNAEYNPFTHNNAVFNKLSEITNNMIS